MQSHIQSRADFFQRMVCPKMLNDKLRQPELLVFNQLSAEGVFDRPLEIGAVDIDRISVVRYEAGISEKAYGRSQDCAATLITIRRYVCASAGETNSEWHSGSDGVLHCNFISENEPRLSPAIDPN